MHRSKNQVFFVVALLCAIVCSYVQCGYVSLGCYKDTENRAIPPLEGKDQILDKHYHHRENAIPKCAVAAMKRGYKMFAVQDGGWCAASEAAPNTFNKYGKSSACKSDSEGGPWANHVYLTKGYVSVGCYKDTAIRAIPPLEGEDPILDGAYLLRANPIAKCAAAAMRRGYHMFAVQDSGWCASSEAAHLTFDKYGTSEACSNGGEGGPWANEVYFIVP